MSADSKSAVRGAALEMMVAATKCATAATRLHLANAIEPFPEGFIDLMDELQGLEKQCERVSQALYNAAGGKAVPA